MRKRKCVLITLIIAVLLGVSVVYAGIDEGLVAYWPLNNNLNDVTGHGYNGESINGTVSYIQGVEGNGLKLPGTADARISVSPWAPGNSSLTISGWIKVMNVDELWNGYMGPIYSSQDGNYSHGFNIKVATRGEVLQIEFTACGNVYTGNHAFHILEPQEFYGKWHNFTGVADRGNSELRLYYDGKLVTTSALTTGAIYPTKAFIGSHDYSWPRDGHTRFVSPLHRLDEIRLYSRVLSSTEIHELVLLGSITPIKAVEREALIALYNSTNGDYWKNNSGWKLAPLASDGFSIPGTEGNWFGVITGEENGQNHVLQLNLQYNDLQGTLPPTLSNITHLRFLNLKGNSIIGGIPTWLGNLLNLQELTFAYNTLGGTIPNELEALTDLKILNLSGCQLSGTIPTWIDSLTNIEQLVLASNNFTGTIPLEISNLGSIRNINLGNNNFDPGPIPAWLGNLDNLQYLQLYGNNFNGAIPAELGSLTKLLTLHLANNQLSGELPTELGTLINLIKLDVSNNQLEGYIIPELGGLINLKTLYLQLNQLSEEVPQELMNLTGLVNLSLQRNNGLFTSDPALIAWLDNLNPEWDD